MTFLPFAAKPLGFFARLNEDFHNWLEGRDQVRTGRRGNNSHVMTLATYPRLEIVMHIPTRHTYCAKHGIPFDGPQATTMQPMQQGAMYPPPGPMQQGAMYPPPGPMQQGAMYPPQGTMYPGPMPPAPAPGMGFVMTTSEQAPPPYQPPS